MARDDNYSIAEDLFEVIGKTVNNTSRFSQHDSIEIFESVASLCETAADAIKEELGED